MPDKTNTPAAGIPTTIADEFDDDTPPPIDMPVAKVRAATVPGVLVTPAHQPAPRSSARQALHKIDELAKDLKTHTERDNENLQQVNSTLMDLTKAVGKTETAIASVTGEVSKLASTLEIRQDQEDRIREDERARARAELELEYAEKRAAIKERDASKAFRRKLFLRALSWLAPIFTAIGGAVAIAVHHGCGR